MSYRTRRRLRGMGYTLDDLISASGMEQCDPRDSACVGRNAQRDNAAVDQWMTVMKDPNTANLPVPSFNVNVDSSAGALNAFMNNQPLTSETSQLGSGPVVSVAQLEQAYTPPAASPKPKAAAGTTPSGAVITASNGVSTDTTTPIGSPAFNLGGFSFPSLPWYAWAGMAAVGIFAFGGGGRGR